MLARSRGVARQGVEARLVDVEVDVASGGVSAFRIVGLGRAGGAGIEQRLRAAFRNAGLALPSSSITVNLAPASLAKEAPPLDLAVAAALLAALGRAPRDAAAEVAFLGELALDARVRPVAGALAAAEAARAGRLARLACAPGVAAEAAAVPGVAVHAVATVREALALLRGEGPPPSAPPAAEAEAPAPGHPDLADVQGQLVGRRALELAAAGGHGLLLVGPPGAGKSMLARRLPGVLPALAVSEAVEVTRVHSAAGLLLGRGGPGGLVRTRPFRAPHHSISGPGLLGGGSPVRPGEASLAHRGVLFLDELPEFRRDVLDGLRQPLEDGTVSVVRAQSRATLPCRFQLVAAMNPCGRVAFCLGFQTKSERPWSQATAGGTGGRCGPPLFLW